MAQNPLTRNQIRGLISLVVGLFAVHFVLWLGAAYPTDHRDFAQVWFGARELWQGRNPYASVGYRLAFDWPFPLYYPMPALLAALPVAWLPEHMAAAIMAGVGAGAFAWALSREEWAPLLGLLSFGFYDAVHLAQWSPLLAAGLVLTPLSALWICKPTLGAALLAAKPNRWAIMGGLALMLASFAVEPRWIAQWWGALDSDAVQPGYHVGHMAAIQFPGGAVALLALLRWRRPEARLLVALACVPQTMLPYETVLLLLIPRGWIESALMAGLSYLPLLDAMRGGPDGFIGRTLQFATAITWTMYLPATLMILRRPNEGTLPVWLPSWRSNATA